MLKHLQNSMLFSRQQMLRKRSTKMRPTPSSWFLLHTHVEKVMKNCKRSNFGCCEKEIMIHRGGWKSYTYTRKVVLSSLPNVYSLLENLCLNTVQFFSDKTLSLLTASPFPVRYVRFILAGTEQLIWKSTSTSALVGMFLKLMAV